MRRGLKTAALAAAALAMAPLGGTASASTLPSPARLEAATERFLDTHGSTAARADRLNGGISPSAPASSTARVSLPAERVVALYGAPQMGATILGRRSPEAAATRLGSQSRPFAEGGSRPVVGAFDLVSVFATAGGGPDGRYRTRQDPDVIQIYLDQARAVGARLILDIQPGRSTFNKELTVLAPWLAQPDVDLALDPEWNVGRRGIPGKTDGKVGAGQVNRVIERLEQIVADYGLPPKLLVVHQFHRGSVRGRDRIVQSPDVQTVLNFDGIGAPRPKATGYAALSRPTLFDGFSIFYRRDKPRMKPPAILALLPEPDFLLYQ